MSSQHIGKYLSMARRAHSSLLDQKLKPYDISHGQVLLLIALYKNEGVYQQNLCKLYNLNKAGVGRTIKKLEQLGFIIKKTDPEDKRRQLLYLTDKAKQFKPKLFNILNSIENQAKQNLSEEEINTFFNIIQKIYDNLKDNTNS